jgi:hypothetical protein
MDQSQSGGGGREGKQTRPEKGYSCGSGGAVAGALSAISSSGETPAEEVLSRLSGESEKRLDILRENETWEAKLRLQKALDKILVLTRECTIDLRYCAHDSSKTPLHTIIE